MRAALFAAFFPPVACSLACGQTPDTRVVLRNEYPPSSSLVVYRAIWQAVSFQEPIFPGSSSDPQDTVPASSNKAYVILAKGWDPDASAAPTSFVLLESKTGFAVSLDDTLDIPVGDAAFAGNCAAGSTLSQSEADFIVDYVFTSAVFPDAAAPFRYDAATCTTVPTP